MASAIECANCFFGKNTKRAEFCKTYINKQSTLPALDKGKKGITGNTAVYIHAYISRFLLMVFDGLALFGKNFHLDEEEWDQFKLQFPNIC